MTGRGFDREFATDHLQPFPVLFNKNQDTLIQCPCSKDGDYAIPQSVTNIDIEAFYECYLLTTVTIPGSVTSIGQETFYFCESLTNVTLGGGITSIGSDAFASCDSLATVHFKEIHRRQPMISMCFRMTRPGLCITSPPPPAGALV
jgi:hypothetical protein